MASKNKTGRQILKRERQIRLKLSQFYCNYLVVCLINNLFVENIESAKEK
jgi:hypothetical protein